MKKLLVVGAAAGFAAVFIFRRNLAAEADMLGYLGFLSDEILSAPLSVEKVKSLFSVPAAAMIYFDFFDIINVMLVSILFTPVLLLTAKKSPRGAAAGFILLGITFVFYTAANRTLPFMVNISSNAELERIINSSGFYGRLSETAVFLFYSTGLYIAVLMRRSGIFSGTAFVFGLAACITGLMYFAAEPVAGEYRYFAIVVSAPFTIIWHFNLSFNCIKIRTWQFT